MRDELRPLAMRVGLGVAIALLLILGGPFVYLGFHPVLTVVAGAVVGMLVWAARFIEWPMPTPWEQPSWRGRSPLLQADLRTRRLAQSLQNAQPSRTFDARRVAQQLANLTATRLVATGRVQSDDPLAHADPHLSPGLLKYLRSADSGKPMALSRRALHSHLKEIDSL